MTIHFGLQFDDLVYPATIKSHAFGPKKMLQLLSTWLGLVGDAEDNEYLRVVRYRQALRQYLQTNPEVFYAASFQADAFSTANVLLQRRDELLLTGFFSLSADKIQYPERLKVWRDIEATLLELGGLLRGQADMMMQILAQISDFKLFIDNFYCYDIFDNLPAFWQRTIHQLELKGVTIQYRNIESTEIEKTDTDLNVFRQKLYYNTTGSIEPKVDGSLLIVKAKRETELAEWFAKIKKEHADYQPLCLIPETNRALDAAFVMEGLPALGIASSSSARPVLQLLKLVTTFLWKPLDPHRILEFLSLALKPLDRRLAYTIAEIMAEKPGMYSQLWAARLGQFWESLHQRVKEGKSIDIQAIKDEYSFWFERRRYDISQRAPKGEIIAIFEYLAKWAVTAFANDKKTPSLLVLATQAEKIAELLEALPERDLSNLELERIVRTIHKPSPVFLEQKEVGSLDYIHYGGAFATKVSDMMWWNFTDHSTTPSMNFWRREEIDFLAEANCAVEPKTKENALLLAYAQRPVIATKGRLLLLVPETINGKEAVEHPLMGYLRATFTHISPFIFDLDAPDFDESRLKSFFRLPSKNIIATQDFNGASPFLHIENLADYKSRRDYESLTSLEDLLYYPYKWVFKYKAKLSASAILSISKDVRLMGNLAHRAFELMLTEQFTSWSQEQVNEWISATMPDIMFKEGATLLMYGKEQEREMFLNKLKYAAWSLISMINNNKWTVVATEQAMNGTFQGTELRGKADLILERSNGEYAIIDLKWSGITSRRNLLKNMEDLQLVMYADLMQQPQVPHTAYFIIDKGKMLARNLMAFKEAELVVSASSDAAEVHQAILEKMQHTYQWRRRQLDKGLIEVRTAETALELERIYDAEGEQLLQMLEMKQEDARYDDYGVIVRGGL